MAVVVLILIATSFMCFFIGNKSTHNQTPKASTNTNSDPSYKFISKTASTDMIKFTFYVSSNNDKFVIKTNNKVISYLKKTGQISSSTKNYSILYFDDEEAAKNYSNSKHQANNNVKSIKDRGHFIAIMSFSKSMKQNSLFSMTHLKILKNY